MIQKKTGFVFLVSLFLTSIFAEDILYQDADIKMNIPHFWTMQYEDNGQIAIEPNGEVVIIFMMLKSTDIDNAIKEAKDYIDSSITGVTELTDITNFSLNGMKAYAYDAKGILNNISEIDIGVMILFTPNNKIIMILGLALSETFKNHEKTFTDILNSITPNK